MIILAWGWWSLWTSRTANNIANSWIEYWNFRDSPDDLPRITERHKGTTAARAAKLTRADALFDRGVRSALGDPGELIRQTDPAETMRSFEQAFALYEEVSQNPGNNRELAVRALVGAGKCQEWLGQLDRARAFYRTVVERYGSERTNPDSPVGPLVQEAETRLQRLDPANAEAVALYKNWPERLPKLELPPSKPAPPFPPPGSPPPLVP
jgi:tetratricopeptide (TPR) repeat protein